MDKYFNINYEFDREQVHHMIEKQMSCDEANYICVADGVIANIANRTPEYLRVVNDGMFSVCDSSCVPLYIRWIYGKKYKQYCGSEIFKDIISSRKYRMIFLGTQQSILDGLKENLKKYNPDVAGMQFVELPFRNVEDFDYPGIAQLVEQDKADIIWVALGAPKQEYFMHYLKPHLNHGVLIAVGAAFKFFSGGADVKRAPQWMIRYHMEFIHRIIMEPKKQIPRCYDIIRTLPGLLYSEWRRSKKQTDAAV